MLKKTFLITITLIFFMSFLPFGVQAMVESDTPTCQVCYNQGEVYFVEELERFQSLQKPTVAVALGGGGARALVNIGVLKALEEEAIPVDMVIGTSMGAIVAVMYGSGMPLEQMENLVTLLDLPQMFSLNFPFYKSLLNTVEFNQFLEKISKEKELDQLPIPTALLSYDLTYGVKYIHTTGPISTAVQGPYAIPICFQGQKINDFFLIDAGMTELTPAGAARALGADFVISTTAYDALPYTKYNNSFRSTIRLINLIKEEYARKVVDTNSDIVIAHNVGDYSFMDFHLANQFIQLGYDETKKMVPLIKEKLQKNGISLQEPSSKEDLDIDPLLNDLANNRLILDKLVWKPLFYIGKDHSRFNQNLLKPSYFSPQYGLELKKGRVNSFLLTRGNGLDNLEVELKIKKVSPRLDLLGKVGVMHTGAEEESQWETGVIYYGDDYFVSTGWLNNHGNNYLHFKSYYQLQWPLISIKGETDLYYPFNSRVDNSLKIVSYQGLEYYLNDNYIIESKLLYHNTDLMNIPQIYRGISNYNGYDTNNDGNNTDIIASNTNNLAKLQLSLDCTYNYQFRYSKEILQIILLTGVKCNQFIDYQSGGSVAVGVGGSIDFKILGLKPSRFSGYLSYDFLAQKPKTGVEIDFSF